VDFKQVNKCISVKNITKISTMSLEACQYKCDTIISETDGNYLRITHDGCITGLLIAFQDFLVSGVRGQMTEVRGQKSEDRGQKSEDRGQRSESRGQRTEDRGQKSEDRKQDEQLRVTS